MEKKPYHSVGLEYSMHKPKRQIKGYDKLSKTLFSITNEQGSEILAYKTKDTAKHDIFPVCTETIIDYSHIHYL